MANVVVGVLSVTIGLFFVLIGTIKLTPAISDEVYKEMVTKSPILIFNAMVEFIWRLRNTE